MRITCMCCNHSFDERLIDYKPTSMAKKPATLEMLAKAADRGEDFDFPACRECYGPAFVEGVRP